MTPQEKAKELVDKFIDEMIECDAYFINSGAKKCALIAVDEIIKAIDFDWMEVQNLDREHAYWDKVKEEIEKL